MPVSLHIETVVHVTVGFPDDNGNIVGRQVIEARTEELSPVGWESLYGAIQRGRQEVEARQAMAAGE